MRPLTTLLVLWLALSAGPVRADETSTNEDTFNLQKSISNWSDTVQDIVMRAISLTGVQYKYGGKSPETGFDCSGFVRYVFQQATNLTLPHGARAISKLGQSIPIEQLRPGDLVFFNTLKTAFSHVGIYLGDGRFIHAPSSGGSIKVVDMNERYWTNRFNGARRLPVSARTPAESSAE